MTEQVSIVVQISTKPLSKLPIAAILEMSLIEYV